MMTISPAFAAILVLAASQLIASACADKNQNRTYIDLTRPIPCIRRFNATHQIGCSGVQTGVAYAVRTQIELNRLTDRLTPAVLGSRRLVVLATSPFFSRVLDWALNASSAATADSILAGLVLVEQPANTSTTTPAAFSDDVKSPNVEFSAYRSPPVVNWNSAASRAAMFADFKYPVYVIADPDEAQQPYAKCYDKFNRVTVLDSIILERKISKRIPK